MDMRLCKADLADTEETSVWLYMSQPWCFFTIWELPAFLQHVLYAGVPAWNNPVLPILRANVVLEGLSNEANQPDLLSISKQPSFPGPLIQAESSTPISVV